MLQTIDQHIIDAIPRHPADPNVAYGYDLDPAVIKPLLDQRILTAAIFRGFCSQDELQQQLTPSIENGFRSANAYFNSHAFSPQKDGSGLSVMRLMGFTGQGIFPQTTDYEHRPKSLNDFTGNDWLQQKMAQMSIWPQKKMGEFGFHILHAFKGSAEQGLTPYWHPHEDITAHLTVAGAGVEWLPSDIDERDAMRNPQKYESRVQTAEPGDLIVMGKLLHRSPSKIQSLGQFAIIGGGPLVSEYENS